MWLLKKTERSQNCVHLPKQILIILFWSTKSFDSCGLISTETNLLLMTKFLFLQINTRQLTKLSPKVLKFHE